MIQNGTNPKARSKDIMNFYSMHILLYIACAFLKKLQMDQSQVFPARKDFIWKNQSF